MEDLNKNKLNESELSAVDGGVASASGFKVRPIKPIWIKVTASSLNCRYTPWGEIAKVYERGHRLKVDGITFTYKGVVMPGWGSQDCTSCGYSVDVDGGREAQFHPFISGSAWFNDTIEYKDAKGKMRTSTVRRSTPFSVGVNPGE